MLPNPKKDPRTSSTPKKGERKREREGNKENEVRRVLKIFVGERKGLREGRLEKEEVVRGGGY